MELDKLRTTLANERTLLAYVRTALAIVISGMAAVKFFYETPLVVFLGWLAITAGGVILVWGIFHFRKVSSRIKGDDKTTSGK